MPAPHVCITMDDGTVLRVDMKADAARKDARVCIYDAKTDAERTAILKALRAGECPRKALTKAAKSKKDTEKVAAPAKKPSASGSKQKLTDKK